MFAIPKILDQNALISSLVETFSPILWSREQISPTSLNFQVFVQAKKCAGVKNVRGPVSIIQPNVYCASIFLLDHASIFNMFTLQTLKMGQKLEVLGDVLAGLCQGWPWILVVGSLTKFGMTGGGSGVSEIRWYDWYFKYIEGV